MKKRTRSSFRIRPRSILLVAPLGAVLILCGCPNKKELAAHKASQGTGTSVEPDKVLYERALDNIKHNRYDQGRLDLQTLINTYPDSEYLAKAKLATADSYYKQGGPASLTEAIAQYQDFITFFPFLDEASYAQMQIAMSHYKRMEKPDRDRAEALEAEGAFQTFLQKYPSSPLSKDAQQRLREVQEVLAQGDYAVARFYFLRSADRASAARLYDLVNRYPLFSEADRANWMLATIAERGEHNDIAGQFYARIVKDYPLSPLAGQAKDELVKFGVPVPQADPAAMARMQDEQQIPRLRDRGLLRTPEGMFRTAPDVSMAAHIGTPNMTPENTPTGDTLAQQGNLSVGIAPNRGGAATNPPAAAGAGNGAIVETVVPGSAPASSSPAGSAGSTATTAPDATATIATPATADSGTDSAATGGSASSTDSTASSGDSAASGTTTTAAQNTSPSTSTSTNAQPESTSKKKKGLKKLIPF